MFFYGNSHGNRLIARHLLMARRPFPWQAAHLVRCLFSKTDEALPPATRKQWIIAFYTTDGSRWFYCRGRHCRRHHGRRCLLELGFGVTVTTVEAGSTVGVVTIAGVVTTVEAGSIVGVVTKAGF
jgi:hypothetical protein